MPLVPLERVRNIGVIARRDEWYEFLDGELTAERVHEFLAPLSIGDVERHVLPNLSAFNFLVHDALGGGGSISLRLDAQGKTYAQALFRMPVDLTPEIEADVRAYWGDSLPADCVVEETPEEARADGRDAGRGVHGGLAEVGPARRVLGDAVADALELAAADLGEVRALGRRGGGAVEIGRNAGTAKKFLNPFLLIARGNTVMPGHRVVLFPKGINLFGVVLDRDRPNFQAIVMIRIVEFAEFWHVCHAG